MKSIEILSTTLVLLILFGYMFLPKEYEYINDFSIFALFILIIIYQRREISKLKKRVKDLES